MEEYREKKFINVLDEKVLDDKSKMLLTVLLKFFKDPVNKSILMSIVKQETVISLRLLDWLVTNYSRKYNISYNLDSFNRDSEDPEDSEEDTAIHANRQFNLWAGYRNQLKSYHKKIFDPFCRRTRIYFDFQTNEILVLSPDEYKLFKNSDKGIVSTPGQFNFFKWAIENKVIDYAFEHLEEIESDMLKYADNKEKGVRKKSTLKNNSSYGSDKKVIVSFN